MQSHCSRGAADNTKPAVAAVVFMYALSRTHHPLLYYFIRERIRIIGVIYVYLGSLNEKTLIYGIERATLKIDRVLSDIKTTKYLLFIKIFLSFIT